MLKKCMQYKEFSKHIRASFPFQFSILTLISNLEFGGDKRWGLTSDPCCKRFTSLVCFVILNNLNLREQTPA